MPSLIFRSSEELLRQFDLFARIDVQLYRIEHGGEDRELLAALMAHASSYSGEELRYHLEAAGTHGPFLTRDLTPEMFEPCAIGDARSALAAWLNDGREATSEEAAALSERVLPLLCHPLYRLPNDPEAPESIGASWLEFVAIDRASDCLRVIVAWDD